MLEIQKFSYSSRNNLNCIHKKFQRTDKLQFIHFISSCCNNTKLVRWRSISCLLCFFGNYERYPIWQLICFFCIAFARLMIENCKIIKNYIITSDWIHFHMEWNQSNTPQDTLPSQSSQYFRGGGNTRFFVPSGLLPLFVDCWAPVAVCMGLDSDDWTGQSSVSCWSKTSQMSQNSLGAGFRFTGISNKGFLQRE